MRKKILKKYVALFTILLMLMTTGPLTTLAKPSNNSNLEPPTTGFEDSNGEQWTTHEEELAFLEEVAEMSERVSYSQIGETVEGRPLHLVRVGFPEPPSDEEIADGRNILIIGSQHGNEPAGREMALKLLRNLAFTDDPELLEQLEDATVLFVPTANPDGRVANTRQNAAGVDINRDHLNLEQPEIQAIAKVQNKFHPDITIDAHERPRDTGDPDIEMLWARNLNVDEQLQELNVEMVEDYLMPDVREAGYTTDLYGSPGGAGGGDERIARNMVGLRHGLGLLIETPGKAEPTSRVAMHLETVESALRFYHERFDDVGTVVAGAPERKAVAGADTSNPFYLDGADNWDPTVVLEKQPSGYLLTEAQSVEISKYVELFSLETEAVDGDGVFITMNQPMMTVVPFLLDERATYNEVNELALYDDSEVGTAANMKSLVEHYQDEDAFTNDSDVRTLLMHLTAVDRFEKKEAADKVVKHMNSFNMLLDHQKDNDLIAEPAYNALKTYADYLINKWEVAAFDSNNAMDHLSYLSEDIGPRVTGTDAEEQAATYIKDEFASLGYDVSTQAFAIRGDQESQNVIAVKKPKDAENTEIVYVTAHYDSVPGSPGANDNGSGTSTLLELARVMKDVPTNKEIRFVAFGAEEIGLVGSRYYVSQLSQAEKDRSVANFNLDMVGTDWEPASQLYISPVDGEPNQVWESSKAAAEKLGLDDDKLFLYPFGRSDHVPFYEAGIDSALFIWREPGTGNFEPYYHSPQDTIEHVSPEKIQVVGDLIHSAVSDLASQPASNDNSQEDLLEKAS